MIDEEVETAALAYLRRDQRAKALEILMKAYGPRITAFAFRTMRHRAAAEDVRQQVFLEAYVGMLKFEQRSTFWTWLCGIASHRVIDEIKRQRKSAPDPTFDVLKELGLQPDPTMDTKTNTALRRALEHCLGKVPAPLRTELLMHFFFGLSYVEIEQLLGVAAGTIQVRMARILPKVRRCLKARGVER
jgi:RNA polymerase sigma-70 factor, ECF subfamily